MTKMRLKLSLVVGLMAGCTTAGQLGAGDAAPDHRQDAANHDGATPDASAADAARDRPDGQIADSAVAHADSAIADAVAPDAALECEDLDGDGYGPGCERGSDCAPFDPSIFPGRIEICDEIDQDCDGRADEGIANCCEPGVEQVCTDDVPPGCAQRVRRCGEGNRWGDCINPDAAVELCDGDDDDCDGRVDEGACGLYALGDDEAGWSLVATAEDSPFDGEAVQALIAMDHLRAVWVITDAQVHTFDVRREVWGVSRPRTAAFPNLPAQEINGATAVSQWWAQGSDATDVALTIGDSIHQYQVPDAVGVRGDVVALDNDAWRAPDAPDPSDVTATFVDLNNRRDAYPGSPRELCDAASDSILPAIAVLVSDMLHPVDAGWCFEFAAPFRLAGWSLSQLPNAPPLARALGWAHYDTEAGALDGHYVIAPLPGH